MTGGGGSDGLRALADAMPQLVWTAGSDGIVDYYNARVEDYGGWTLVDGHYRWEPLVHPDDLEGTLAAWSAAVEASAVYEYEHRILMADGTYRWHLSRAVPMPGDGGAATTWYGTATDVHARKLSDERQANVAHTLQVALMPSSLPSTEQFRLAARYRPATAGEQVGGDWYDAVLTGSRLTLVIGDAAGHGVEAAAVMGAARHSVATSLLAGQGPAAALHQADRYLQHLGGAYVTCLAASIELPRRRLIIASAGHHPPFLIADGQPVRMIEVLPGGPLGVGLANGGDHVVELAAGPTTLVLVTDGLIERRERSIDDALARLAEVLHELRDGTPEAICDGLIARFNQVSDDVAILAAAFEVP